MSYWGIGALIFSALTTATSAAVTADNARKQANYQGEVADANNLLIERQQISNANAAADQAADKREETLRMMARQNVAGAGGGIEVGTGSLGKIQDETSQTGTLDMLRILNNAQQGNQSLKLEQMNNNANAALGKLSAKNTKTQSILTTIGAAAGTASSLSSNYTWKDGSLAFRNTGKVK